MKTITIKNPFNDSLIAQLSSLYYAFRGLKKGERVQFDLSNLSWLYPLLVLPLNAYIKTTNGTFLHGNSLKLKTYLETIRFPSGVDSVTSFEEQVQRSKNFTPISILKKHTGQERERLESLFLNMISKVLGQVKGTDNAVFYPITELVTNIFEHSGQEEGFVFGQFYPNKNYLDICIVDRGRGLAATYLNKKQLTLSDEQAIEEVMKGNSTKPDKDRGFGVRTSKSVICKALHGSFVLISGSAALVSVKDKEKLINLKDFFWQGVIIGYRIPKPMEAVDISPYLE